MEYIIREQFASGNMARRKCMWCRKKFKADEKIVVIIPSCKYKDMYRSFYKNWIMHLDEYVELLKQCEGNQEKLMHVLGRHKTTRRKDLSGAQMMRLEAFKNSCIRLGFCNELEISDEIYMKKDGYAMTLIYNARTGILKSKSKGSVLPGDIVIRRELESKVQGIMAEILRSNN